MVTSLSDFAMFRCVPNSNKNSMVMLLSDIVFNIDYL